MTKPGTFEYLFADFVTAFGGEVLPEANKGKTADYLFRRYNVIAELKTLSEDSTASMNEKVSNFLREWGGDWTQLPLEEDATGKQFVRITNMPSQVADKWIAKVVQQVERLVHDANKQIADTKAREGLRNARGILLIANPKNVYHNDPEGYKQILASILRKKDAGGFLRFPHINGCVFFAAGDVLTPERGYFWASMQMQQWIGENISDIKLFQSDLLLGLQAYIRNTIALIAERDAGQSEESNS